MDSKLRSIYENLKQKYSEKKTLNEDEKSKGRNQVPLKLTLLRRHFNCCIISHEYRSCLEKSRGIKCLNIGIGEMAIMSTFQ